MRKIKDWTAFLEKKRNMKDFTGEDRIVLLGPPTIGKSTLAKALGKALKLEVVSLDRLQPDFGYGEKNEVKCVEHVLSEKFDKYDTPSILDFGGGHVYAGDVSKLLKAYKNTFVLVPSEDLETSHELLLKSHEKRLRNTTDKELEKVKDLYEKGWKGMDEDKAKEIIANIKAMLDGKAGQISVADLPPKMKTEFTNSSFYKSQKVKYFWKVDGKWRKFQNLLTKKHDRINRSITDNIIEVYTEKKRRRSVSSIVNEIVSAVK